MLSLLLVLFVIAGWIQDTSQIDCLGNLLDNINRSVLATSPDLDRLSNMHLNVHTERIHADGSKFLFRKRFTVGKKHYLISINGLYMGVWPKQLCPMYGGHYAEIENEAEFQAVVNELNNLKTICLWIGSHDTGSEGQFKFFHSERPAFTKWAPGEPNGSTTENCVFLKGANYLMNDAPCMINYHCHFLCQLN